MDSGRASWLSTATALFFSWAILFFAVRIWVTVQRKQSWSHSDTSAVAAFAVALLHVATTFWAINSNYGRPLDNIEEPTLGDLQKALFISQLSYIASVGLTKISTSFFIGNLTRYAPQVRMSLILAAASGIWIVVSLFVVALRPDLIRPWATLDGTEALYYRWIAVETVGLAIEVAIWLLSISLVWSLQMKLERRILVLSVFGSRLLLTPIVALRLFYLSPQRNYEPTITSIVPYIFTEAVLEYALISTSITALKPFLKPFHTGAIVNTVGGSASGIYSGSHSATHQGVYMLSSSQKTKRQLGKSTTPTTMSASVNSDRDDQESHPPTGPFRADGGGFTAIVSTQNDQHPEEIQSVESDGSEKMIIRTQKAWTVRYENE